MYKSIAPLNAMPARADAVAALFFEDDKTLPPGYSSVDGELGGVLRDAIARPEWSAARGKVTWLYPAKGAERIYLPGEMEWARREQALVSGIKLPDDVVLSLLALADGIGLDVKGILR